MVYMLYPSDRTTNSYDEFGDDKWQDAASYIYKKPDDYKEIRKLSQSTHGWVPDWQGG